MAESTVRSAIKSLEQAGLLTIKKREIEGRSASNLYLLAVDNSSPEPNDRVPKRQEFRVPKSGTESNTKEPPIKERCARDAHAARLDAGHSLSGAVGDLEIDQQTGIHHDQSNKRDQAALKRIHYEFDAAMVRAAVEQAAKLDPHTRAFPSAVLKILLRQNKTESTSWSRGAYTNIHSDSGGRGEIIDI